MIINTKELKAAMVILNRVKINAVLPALYYVHIASDGDSATLSVTNLETTISIKVGASDTGGVCLLPIKSFNRVLKGFSGDTTEIVAGDTVTVASGKRMVDMNTLDIDEYPPLKHSTLPIFDVYDLGKGLERTLISAATEDTRPILNGVYLKADGASLELAAADGYRLSISKHTLTFCPDPVVAVLPLDAMKLLYGIIKKNEYPISVHADKERITFQYGDITLTTYGLNGRFPDYTTIVPTNHLWASKIDAKEMLAATKFVHEFAQENAYSMKLSATEGNTLTLTGKSDTLGVASDSIQCNVIDGINMSINSAYLIDGLKVCDGEATLHYGGGEIPLVFTSDTFTYVIMPMSL